MSKNRSSLAATMTEAPVVPVSSSPAPVTRARKPRKVKIDPATGQPVKRDPAVARAKAARKWAVTNGVEAALAVITSPVVRDLIGSQALAVSTVERRVAALDKRKARILARAADATAALASHLPALQEVAAALKGVGAKQIAALESTAAAVAAKQQEETAKVAAAKEAKRAARAGETPAEAPATEAPAL